MDRSPAATLTRSLLVRKGAAIPTPTVPLPTADSSPDPREPVPNLVLLGREALAGDRARPHVGKGGRGPTEERRRLTLRLDVARHRRLKLAATHLGISLQDVLIAALDGHLARVAPGLAAGGCACLAGTPRGEETSQ
jgi:hypothetical protein